MKKLLPIYILLLSSCTHYGIRDQEPDESREDYIQAVVDFNDGYKPADYKCPHNYELVKFGDGYICPYWDSEWETEDTLMIIEASVIVLIFAILL